MITVMKVYPKVVDVRCFSHVVDDAGDTELYYLYPPSLPLAVELPLRPQPSQSTRLEGMYWHFHHAMLTDNIVELVGSLLRFCLLCRRDYSKPVTDLLHLAR